MFHSWVKKGCSASFLKKISNFNEPLPRNHTVLDHPVDSFVFLLYLQIALTHFQNKMNKTNNKLCSKMSRDFIHRITLFTDKTKSQGTQNYTQNAVFTGLPDFHRCAICTPLLPGSGPLHGQSVVQFPLLRGTWRGCMNPCWFWLSFLLQL